MDSEQPFEYKIGNKLFELKPDFTFEELEWLDIIYNKLSINENKNEVNGNFTKEEIEKTMSVLLIGKDNSKFEHNDFMIMKELSQAVKILADFFLSKAILGAFTSGTLMN